MRILILYIFISFNSFFSQKERIFIEKLLNTALLDDLNNQSSSLSIDSLYKANLKPQLNANLFANYKVISAMILRSVMVKMVVQCELFAKDIWQTKKTISLLPSPY
jgi:hypothetical protein